MNCPNCKSSRIAEILWGYPPNMDLIKDELEKKEIALGGYLVTDLDPKWECNDCHTRFGHREDDETDSNNANSFDFDQGFNLDEVYDQ